MTTVSTEAPVNVQLQLQFILELRNSYHTTSLYSFVSVKKVRPFTINGYKDNEEAVGNKEKNDEEN